MLEENLDFICWSTVQYKKMTPASSSLKPWYLLRIFIPYKVYFIFLILIDNRCLNISIFHDWFKTIDLIFLTFQSKLLYFAVKQYDFCIFIDTSQSFS